MSAARESDARHTTGGSRAVTVTPERVLLGSADGIHVSLLDYGASIESIRVPAADGVVDVVLAYPHPADYLHDRFFMGATVGRYAGRLRRGNLESDGPGSKEAMPRIETGHCLHGGPKGLHSRFWQIDSSATPDRALFRYESPDGEGGFPGNLSVTVSYAIRGNSVLDIEFLAVSDRDTVINLANHAYFNLNGNLNGNTSSIDDHLIAIAADAYTAHDGELIPTGDIVAVQGTPLDLRRAVSIGSVLERLARTEETAAGIDHNFVLRKAAGDFTTAAAVSAPKTGLGLDIHTTQPGLQFYSGDGLEAPFSARRGFCLEAQNFPDAPNHAAFPSALLRPGKEYRQRTSYSFEKRSGAKDLTDAQRHGSET